MIGFTSPAGDEALNYEGASALVISHGVSAGGA